ncbi:prepilin peptidase [Gordonia hankookensis]|uniref:Prepilin peptidase n=1 Tax=Gordonia hankookensis TaxID=589403 RepID=A0ABR7WHD8_9ACTN|nr:prepilin peptidase [Gordonia hankookensis]MBD1321898.1 prepilin peptidase [Gordonia hankookensis]
MSSFLVLIWLVVVAVGDLRTGRIATVLVWPGVAATVGMSIEHPGVLAAALATATPYLLAALARACGGGDLKLAFVVGGMIGDVGTGLMVVVSAAVVTAMAHLRGPARETGRPHGPALVTAALCALGIE